MIMVIILAMLHVRSLSNKKRNPIIRINVIKNIRTYFILCYTFTVAKILLFLIKGKSFSENVRIALLCNFLFVYLHHKNKMKTNGKYI